MTTKNPTPIKAAIYARYSSDNQREASLEDQIRLCKEAADREGWTITKTYQDSAMSGASLMRPGIQSLMEDALKGKFSIILTEALDRLSRDQEDIAGLYKRMSFADVRIITLSEGEVNNLHIGLKGTMNALYLKDLADKTRRGLRGRIEQGKSGGGLTYGYEVRRSLDAEGNKVTGERKINQKEAAVIRRIFEDFAKGKSPRAIAKALNGEGVPGPRKKTWTGSTIRGHNKRGTGILNNELYIGRLVWNRMRYIKDPETGKRVSRLNPPEQWVIQEVPELRIIDQALWDITRDRKAQIQERYQNQIEGVRNALANTRRPKHLLSGLLSCGHCGGRYSIVSQDRYGCFNARNRNTCSNTHTIKRQRIEERVLHGLKDKLITPEVVETIIREMQQEANRLQRERLQGHDQKKKDLAAIESKMMRYVEAIGDGTDLPLMHTQLKELEVERKRLEQELSQEPIKLPDLHPGIATLYREKVERLTEALNDPASLDEAGEAIRSLIDKIILTPIEDKDGTNTLEVALYGELDALLHFMTSKENALQPSTRAVRPSHSPRNQVTGNDDNSNEPNSLQITESHPSDMEGRLYCLSGCGGRISLVALLLVSFAKNLQIGLWPLCKDQILDPAHKV
ncbi:recombinase family protein [Emcibacter nanhaiensis]|nr:recombinase family protein [Emcibacter nanhaiensis]